MAETVYVPTPGALREVCGMQEVLDACMERAEAICTNANSMVGPDDMRNDPFSFNGRIDSKGMARASCYSSNPHGYRADLEYNVLLKAMG